MSVCTCADGYSGTNCEMEDECITLVPCMNGATCMDTDDAAGYTCSCAPGYDGTNCTDDINECMDNPCKKGATCIDLINEYKCTCPVGFNGTHCEYGCPGGTYGNYCVESCTCVDGANCSHVNGTCECVPAFMGAVCDKRELAVSSYRTSNDTIMRGEEFTLACEVNLIGIDLAEVAWYRGDVKLPMETDPDYRIENNTDYRIENNPDLGMYNITILDADADDTGSYVCTAVTDINSTSSDAILIDVVVPGQIDLGRSKTKDTVRLNETASLNCTVFSSSQDTNITWRRNGSLLVDGENRVSIVPGQGVGTGGTYFFSQLEVSGIVREDGGVYTCLALDGEGNVTDEVDFQIYVQEIAELANPRYDDIRSKQLSLVWDFTVQGNSKINCTAQYKVSGTNATEEQDVGGNPPGFVTGLKPFTTYEFDLLCVNLVGPSEPLHFGTEKTLAGEPSAPRNVRVSDIQARQVFVQWDEPAVLRNDKIDSYSLTASSSNGQSDENISGPATSYIFEGLKPYTQYTISVQAVNLNAKEGIQTSEKAESQSFRTLQAAPGAPSYLNVEDTPTQCRVSWNPPSEPNGIIQIYTLYYKILRRDTESVAGGDRTQQDSSKRSYTIEKSQLDPFSIYHFSLTASTEPGEGINATTDQTCETLQGVPVLPPMIPTPAENDITTTSFKTSLPSYDQRNGPVSCFEVIVVRLQNIAAGENLNSRDQTYSPGEIKSHEEAKNNVGIPYRALVFRTPPADGVITIGGEISDTSSCHTGAGPSSGRRRRRETTMAEQLDAINGPLNVGGIYSSFVRVYTPAEDQPGMAFYESGPFMEPVTLNSETPVGAIVGGIFGFVIAVCLVIVIFILLKRRKKDKAGDPLMTPTSNGMRENGNGTVIGMQNLGIEDDEMIVKPIKLEHLEKAIREKAKDERKEFWAEYKALPQRPPPLATMNNSNLPANKDKNRYINIIAYDHTRVKLKPIDGIEGSDYINASYVNGYQSPDKFIAAQGPKDNTVDDFWRMIWEYNCSTIVMLTRCIEENRDKCTQYWPDKGSAKYGKLIVQMDTLKETAEYVIRSFFLSEDGKDTGQRSITQFHFLGWPDHGQPDYPSPMMNLIKRVRYVTSKMNHRANIVVHCSAGVGRTGTYIVIDAMLDMMKNEKQVDVYNFIHEIRQQRNTLVQSFVQYFFIHLALLEEHLFGQSDVGMSDFPEYYQQLGDKSDVDDDLTRLEVEFRRACKLGVNGTEQKFANVEQNKDKNRIGHILPFDKNVVKLQRLVGEEFSDYINASYITGYQRKKMYIATQGPLPNTIADFWRMIWESETSTIVMLTEISQKGHEMCAQYWPLEENEMEEHGDISVTLVEESDDDEAFTIRDLEISHTQVMQNIYGNVDASGQASALANENSDGDEDENADEDSALYGNVPKTTESPTATSMKDVRKIRQYHFRGWPEVGVPESGVDLMHLVNQSHLHQKDKGPHPIVVHCSAGSGRTGVFIGLNILMSRMEEESMIDVFQTVRGLRQQRPHMVQDLAQYKLCYTAMAEYIESQSNEYQNFVRRV